MADILGGNGWLLPFAAVSEHLFNLPLNARAINAINVYNKTIFRQRQGVQMQMSL